MSHAATKWALKQRGLKPAAKIVLFYLCDHHNDENGCFPSQATLAAECEISRASLNNQLDELEARGLLRRHASMGERTKRQRPTRYILAFEEGFSGQKSDTARVHNLDNPVSRNQTRPVSKNDEKPCPNFDESRVQIMDTNPVREPLSQAKPCEAEQKSDRISAIRDGIVDALGLTGREMNTSGTFAVVGMDPRNLEASLMVWRGHGLNDDQILAAIRAKLAAERGRDPTFMPRGIRFFDGPIADFAKRLGPGRQVSQPPQADQAKPLADPAAEAERLGLVAELEGLRGSNSDAAFDRRRKIIARMQELQPMRAAE